MRVRNVQGDFGGSLVSGKRSGLGFWEGKERNADRVGKIFF